jgi:hypothetical protein
MHEMQHERVYRVVRLVEDKVKQRVKGVHV